jgi:DNA/RNA endonuclease YhcR with UshA esterase domain
MNLREVALAASLVLLGATLSACGSTPSTSSSSPSSMPGGPLPAATPAQSEPASADATVVIAWSEAAVRLGQVATVEGPVVSVENGDASVILNVGLDAPDPGRFVVVISPALRAKLAPQLAEHFDGRLIRVTGRIEPLRGVAAVRLARPSDISLEP